MTHMQHKTFCNLHDDVYAANSAGTQPRTNSVHATQWVIYKALHNQTLTGYLPLAAPAGPSPSSCYLPLPRPLLLHPSLCLSLPCQPLPLRPALLPPSLCPCLHS